MAEISSNRATVVLVCDSDTTLSEHLSRHLSANRVQVVAATSGVAARLMIDQHRPAIVIFDPAVQGAMELLKHIRSTDFGSIVIALTVSSEMTELLHAMGVELTVDKKTESHLILDAIQAYADAQYTEVEEEPALILIVDDDKDTLEVLSHVLDAWGFAALTAATGAETLEKLQKNPRIVLILLDLRLPDRGGMELLKEAKEMRPGINVIMMSALADREIARQAIQIGAFDYLAKPIELASLKSEIIASLSHAEYQKQSWWKRLIS